MRDGNLSEMTSRSDGITFEVERVAHRDGRLEVTGRWYGVRGRRFVRPTLTVTRPGRDGEQRLLADLEHKPWAAEEGDAWTAAFPSEGPLGDDAGLELAVAPDITVTVSETGPGEDTAGPTVASAAEARTPVVRSAPATQRPRMRSPEAERLRERLDAAEVAIARERGRRETVEQRLEEERKDARRLQAEVGRLKAEQDLAATVQRELDAAAAELDRLRTQARETARRLEQSERALDQQRTAGEEAHRTADRLRRQLEDADAAVKRLTASGESDPDGGEGEPEWPAAALVERHPVIHQPPPPRTERPVNPSLRDQGWIVRGLALVMIAIVTVAIVIVINSTIG